MTDPESKILFHFRVFFPEIPINVNLDLSLEVLFPEMLTSYHPIRTATNACDEYEESW